ncbi:fumarylacetoacetate hydrolase family protein [Arthrobacter sp. MI7-26]|uniref:fumarylacetoacetate hydrolase family protein n=1 Tax=Arthrobacter sp. MI7-26 TaxID=2993653 RepID=UPI0022493CE9|nr:fumarylacetoacetate hydrolase family protein [Arthrobacter sp. MI7-26]MCX2749259.1 fumarylacetoacetate hydrolase family protein [Arthrobacter sp. MI7-26]
MKLIGVRTPGTDDTRIAVTEGHGKARVLTTLQGFWADPARWLGNEPADGQLLSTEDVRIVPPVLPEARVICIGLNYRAHAAEGSYKDQELPPHPTLFARWTQSLSVDGVPAPVPANEAGLDWEGEIAAYIGRPLVDADAETARKAVVGYSTFNDLTSRVAQKLTSQWILGKNGDNSGPLGPLVTADEVGDLREGLRVQTRVNGTTVQDGNTKDMIYDLGETLSLISRTFTLRPGDIICTGTPEGVGYARTPQWLLQPGDVVEVEVDKLGVLTTPIVGNDYRHGATP